jgi:hypothetical protein
MGKRAPLPKAHPKGEDFSGLPDLPPPHRVDTIGGPLHVKWENDSEVTAHGSLTYFVQFLKVSKLWEDWVRDCPLAYTSPNAPRKEEILGTILLSVLAGHKRYSHITSMRQDLVLPQLLGLSCLRSEDSVRRAFAQVDEDAATLWMDLHLNRTFEPLLGVPWILDLDATVKPLYGEQEEARLGYNPQKPGRPSHVYQAFLCSAAKLVLNVDVQAGNQTASEYAQPVLWGWLDARDRELWPALLRGDVAHGSENMMKEAEARKLPYLFKLKRSPGVLKLIQELDAKGVNWQEAGGHWRGVESSIQLQGWSRERRVVVLRRKVGAKPEGFEDLEPGNEQMALPGLEWQDQKGERYEHVVLVTSWTESDVLAVAQMYRDRAGAENMFDELKNQWGWTGFTTRDHKRSQLMARIVALIFNWWSIFTRMATRDVHREALTTRPLFLFSLARKTRSGGQNFLTIQSMHAKAGKIAHLLARMSGWFANFKTIAEQLRLEQRWHVMLRWIFQHFTAERRDGRLLEGAG